MRLEYFQMIDRVDRFDAAAGEIEATAIVPAESPVFEGHFPGHPLMPGVLLIETMAQASGYLILGCGGFDRMPFFASIKNGKLRTFVAPGTRLAVSARLVHSGSGYSVTEARIAVDGKRTCDCELTFRLVPFDGEVFLAAMRAQAERIGLVAAMGG